MIDIHTHILPGIDDGSRDLYESLEMARIAAEHGTRYMIATPHCNIPGRYHNYFDSRYRENFRRTAEAIREAGIPLTLYPGMEVYMTDEVPELIQAGRIMTLNGSHYMLLEFAFDSDPNDADRFLEGVRRLDIIPVIAHVERYYFLQDDPEIVRQWRKKGDVIQCNKGSFFGHFGRDERHTAYELMDRRWVDVIASDTHRPTWRTPNMADARMDLAQEYPEAYLHRLFEVNPGKILSDKPIVPGER